MRKSDFLLKIMENYANLIEISLNVRLNDTVPPPTIAEINNNQIEESHDDKDFKKLFKSVEESIECKLLALDIVKSMSNYFARGKHLKVYTNNIFKGITK